MCSLLLRRRLDGNETKTKEIAFSIPTPMGVVTQCLPHGDLDAEFQLLASFLPRLRLSSTTDLLRSMSNGYDEAMQLSATLVDSERVSSASRSGSARGIHMEILGTEFQASASFSR